MRKLKQQAKETLKARKPEMLLALKKLGDYVVDLKWDFTSWIPLVSKMLPSDICKISKRGNLSKAPPAGRRYLSYAGINLTCSSTALSIG